MVKLRDKGTPFIHTENLWFSYNGDEDTERIPIIRGISIDIEKGSFVAILGHNGSGKSTFAKLLNMILTPDSGKICIDGKDITDGELSEEEIMELRRNIGMVFKTPIISLSRLLLKKMSLSVRKIWEYPLQK